MMCGNFVKIELAHLELQRSALVSAFNDFLACKHSLR